MDLWAVLGIHLQNEYVGVRSRGGGMTAALDTGLPRRQRTGVVAVGSRRDAELTVTVEGCRR